ncbi:uncharacterized protein LOC122297621 [Carya illinoinensis]|uniref:uncharacterized protein LOC122297621 n=1 Tax=Carya illinoinensis TaxID=32201 RepID=UPI001C719EE2|nr:uncharacterized protein LOC122297621 [Carya illinoinensis]
MAKGIDLFSQQLVERVTLVKETQESQQKLLDELVQQMSNLTSSFDSFTRMQSKTQDMIYSSEGSVFEGKLGSCIQRKTDHPWFDFPKFNEKDLPGWIYRVKNYFVYHEIPPQDWILIVSFHLEGQAQAWYRCMETSSWEIMDMSWEDFVREFEARFGAILDDPFASLTKLRQVSSVEEYLQQFEVLACRIKGILPLSFIISCFISGLREDIRLSVKMFEPTSLSDAFCLARTREEVVVANRLRAPVG